VWQPIYARSWRPSSVPRPVLPTEPTAARSRAASPFRTSVSRLVRRPSGRSKKKRAEPPAPRSPLLAAFGEARECVEQRTQLAAALGKAIFHPRWTGVDHRSLEHPGLLEVGQPLGQGCRRDISERLQELVE